MYLYPAFESYLIHAAYPTHIHTHMSNHVYIYECNAASYESDICDMNDTMLLFGIFSDAFEQVWQLSEECETPLFSHRWRHVQRSSILAGNSLHTCTIDERRAEFHLFFQA